MGISNKVPSLTGLSGTCVTSKEGFSFSCHARERFICVCSAFASPGHRSSLPLSRVIRSPGSSSTFCFVRKKRRENFSRRSNPDTSCRPPVASRICRVPMTWLTHGRLSRGPRCARRLFVSLQGRRQGGHKRRRSNRPVRNDAVDLMQQKVSSTVTKV